MEEDPELEILNALLIQQKAKDNTTNLAIVFI